MSEDIVETLRQYGQSMRAGLGFKHMPALFNKAADTIEALRGEVDLIKTLGVGAALETVAQKERAQKAEAEAARLKGALEPFAAACAKADASSEAVRRSGMGNGHGDEASPGWGIRYKHLKAARAALAGDDA